MTSAAFEALERDLGITRAEENPKNFYNEICDVTRDWLERVVLPGQYVVSGEAYAHLMAVAPQFKPHEKRVMGKVMLQMQKEGYLIKGGISNRERSHLGNAREWKRTRV